MKHAHRWLPVLLLVLCASRAPADVVVDYIRTLGQSNTTGIPVSTVGGRVAVDDAGNLYCGTPSGFSFVQKMTPSGRILWQQFLNIPGFQGTAVDGQFLYTCGSGYYAWRQVFRWERDTGKKADGWQLEWKDDEPASGVRSMKLPTAMVVDAKYLYVLDTGAGELRRLDKATGQEAPLAHPVSVADARDLAWSARDTILLLTATSLLELDKEGAVLKSPLIANLSQAVSVDMDRKQNKLYVALGGDPQTPDNRIHLYDADGKPTGETIGSGGDFQGPWTPSKFAFVEGTGDITVGPDGTVWVNPGWSFRLWMDLTALSRFNPTGQHEGAIIGVQGNPIGSDGLAVDAHLDCYLGGMLKVTYDGQVAWTAGLIHAGAQAGQKYPTTIVNTWSQTPVLMGDRLLAYVYPHGQLTEVDPKTGQTIKVLPKLEAGLALGANKDALFILTPKTGELARLPATLTGDPQVFANLGDLSADKSTPINLAVSDDGQRVYVALTKRVICVDTSTGKTLWETPSQGSFVAAAAGYVVAGKAEGYTGLQILDANTGTVLTTYGEKEIANRPALPASNSPFAVATKDGKTYLLAVTRGAVRVYSIRRTTSAPKTKTP